MVWTAATLFSRIAGLSSPRINLEAARVYDSVPAIGRYSWSNEASLNRMASAYHKVIYALRMSNTLARAPSTDLLHNRQDVGFELISAESTYTDVDLLWVRVCLVACSQTKNNVWGCLGYFLENWNGICLRAIELQLTTSCNYWRWTLPVMVLERWPEIWPRRCWEELLLLRGIFLTFTFVPCLLGTNWMLFAPSKATKASGKEMGFLSLFPASLEYYLIFMWRFERWPSSLRKTIGSSSFSFSVFRMTNSVNAVLRCHPANICELRRTGSSFNKY